MVRKKSLGMILSYLNTFLNMLCGLFLSSFLINQLGDTNYGVYQTMSSFANYLVLFEFGTGTVLARNLSACRAKGESTLQEEKNISTIWSVTGALSILIAVVSIVFYLLIPIIYSNVLTKAQIITGKGIFAFIVAFLISSFFSQTLNGIALGYEHYTFSSAVSIVKLVSRTILLVALISRFKNAIFIAITDAFLGIVLVAFSYFYCKKNFHIRINFKKFDRDILRSSLPLCLAMFLQTIVNQANSTVGKFVLGVMSGPESVTLYSVSLYVYSIFSSLSTIPVSLYVPQVTKDVTSGLEGMPLTKTLVGPCRLIVLVSGFVLFGFVTCGKQFVSIVYGREYLISWVMAIILMIPMYINMSNAVVLNVLDVKNKRLARSYILMVTTALNILMTIFGIRWFGFIAVAYATGISTVLQVIILNIYYQKVIGINIGFLFSNTFRGIFPYQILGATVGYFVGAFVTNAYVSFVLSGVTYVVIFVVCFAIFGKSETEGIAIKKYVNKFFKIK